MQNDVAFPKDVDVGVLISSDGLLETHVAAVLDGIPNAFCGYRQIHKQDFWIDARGHVLTQMGRLIAVGSLNFANHNKLWLSSGLHILPSLELLGFRRGICHLVASNCPIEMVASWHARNGLYNQELGHFTPHAGIS
jgi:hypothetical protein